MFKNFKIGPRLLTLITVQIILLVVLAAATVYSIRQGSDTASRLRHTIDQNTQISWMADILRGDLLRTVDSVADEYQTWAEGRESLKNTRTQFERVWREFYSDVYAEEKEFVDEMLTSELAGVRAAFNRFEELLVLEDSIRLRIFKYTDLPDGVNPLLNALVASNSEQQILSNQIAAVADEQNRFAFIALAALGIVGILLSAILGWAVYRSIISPVRKLATTVDGVSEGNFELRTELQGGDELSSLGAAFDGLLDDRLAALVEAEKKNDILNDSVLSLLKGVSGLSNRDLTVSVPVVEDITGPVADAINNMTQQTARVLHRVNDIAQEVGSAANSVDEKANTVTEVAAAQREEIEQTANELAQVTVKMVEIAGLAERCNQAAEVASGTTNEAMDTVNNTLNGMNEIRETIQETGKRMKRLGERSNEITEIVDIINTIAERTHVLALNASMQAASAGEAGRGFAVVADEVQRLAESARESTAQISSLVRNIQIDTNDTIATMDRTISNVVDGTRLAEAAGKQMVQTRDATQELVQSVARIASTSKDQASISKRIRERAALVVKRTRSTADELVEQLKQTQNLVGYANNLLTSVGVFKLPESEQAADK